MGIVNIRHRGAGDQNHAQQRSQTSTLNELMQEDRLLSGKDPGDDLDDSELGEVGCEYAMVEDKICNVPYELYDLPDLREILSLQTWNLNLTEEERFYLAAFLPDMDQEMFGLTIRELLSGDNIFFGSPLEELFLRLKGGFYSLQVSHFREGLKFLQKRGYYHSLRSYHESMAQKFTDMRRTWSNCQPSTSVEERVHIWNSKNNHKPIFLVDLNAFPADEEISRACDRKMTDIPLLKSMKHMNEGSTTHASAIDLNGLTVKTKTKAKGVLKIKPIELNSLQNHIVQPLPSDLREPCKRLPKGVLKIKRQSDPHGQLEGQVAIPMPSEKSSAHLLDVHTSRFSPPQFVSKWHEENVTQKLPFLHQTDSDVDTYTSSKRPELIKDNQKEEYSDVGVRPSNNSHSSQGNVKTVKGIRLHEDSEMQEKIFPLENNESLTKYSGEDGGIGEYRNGDKLWQNSGQRSRMIYESSMDSYPFASENHQRLMTPMYPLVSEAFSKISTFGTDRHRKFPKYSNHSEHRNKDCSDGRANMPSISTTIARVEKDLMFPITYKRKKAFTKLNPVDSIKEPPTVANSEPIVPNIKDSHLIEKTKAVKIKVRGWSDYSAHYRQRMLNGIPHGSPST